MDDTPKETDVVEDPDTELTMSLVSLMSRLQLQEEADTPQARTESTCTSTDSDSATGQQSEATEMDTDCGEDEYMMEPSSQSDIVTAHDTILKQEVNIAEQQSQAQQPSLQADRSEVMPAVE